MKKVCFYISKVLLLILGYSDIVFLLPNFKKLIQLKLLIVQTPFKLFNILFILRLKSENLPFIVKNVELIQYDFLFLHFYSFQCMLLSVFLSLFLLSIAIWVYNFFEYHVTFYFAAFSIRKCNSRFIFGHFVSFIDRDSGRCNDKSKTQIHITCMNLSI